VPLQVRRAKKNISGPKDDALTRNGISALQVVTVAVGTISDSVVPGSTSTSFPAALRVRMHPAVSVTVAVRVNAPLLLSRDVSPIVRGFPSPTEFPPLPVRGVGVALGVLSPVGVAVGVTVGVPGPGVGVGVPSGVAVAAGVLVALGVGVPDGVETPPKHFG
jgi:hypothetical protein